MDININDHLPQHKYIRLFNNEEEYNQAIENRELEECNYSVVNKGNLVERLEYQPSTRTTNNDNLKLMNYFSQDDVRLWAGLKIIWGYFGWEEKDFELNGETLKGGQFYKIKPMTVVKTVPDLYQYQHLNNFLKNVNTVTEYEEQDFSTIKSASYLMNVTNNNRINVPDSYKNLDNLIYNDTHIYFINYGYLIFKKNDIININNLEQNKFIFNTSISYKEYYTTGYLNIINVPKISAKKYTNFNDNLWMYEKEYISKKYNNKDEIIIDGIESFINIDKINICTDLGQYSLSLNNQIGKKLTINIKPIFNCNKYNGGIQLLYNNSNNSLLSEVILNVDMGNDKHIIETYVGNFGFITTRSNTNLNNFYCNDNLTININKLHMNSKTTIYPLFYKIRNCILNIFDWYIENYSIDVFRESIITLNCLNFELVYKYSITLNFLTITLLNNPTIYIYSSKNNYNYNEDNIIELLTADNIIFNNIENSIYLNKFSFYKLTYISDKLINFVYNDAGVSDSVYRNNSLRKIYLNIDTTTDSTFKFISKNDHFDAVSINTNSHDVKINDNIIKTSSISYKSLDTNINKTFIIYNQTNYSLTGDINIDVDNYQTGELNIIINETLNDTYNLKINLKVPILKINTINNTLIQALIYSISVTCNVLDLENIILTKLNNYYLSCNFNDNTQTYKLTYGIYDLNFNDVIDINFEIWHDSLLANINNPNLNSNNKNLDPKLNNVLTINRIVYNMFTNAEKEQLVSCWKTINIRENETE